MRILNLELEINGEVHNCKFYGYSEEELPNEIGPCVYIFSYFNKEYNKWEHHHCSNTSLFYNTFPRKYFKKFLSKYNSNTILIYENSDEDLLLPIQRAVINELNIPYN